VRIAVFGATGSVGSHLVDEVRRRGHDAVPCSRATGQDVVTGAGVAEALDGVDAAVDVTNVLALRRAVAGTFFGTSARTLRAAVDAAGVAHLVVLSIVGVERLRSFGYYEAKCTQERLVLNGDVPATVVRATQFYELAEVMASRAGIGPLSFVPDLRVQPVSARSVAGVLADVALGAPWRGTRPDVAGPGPVTSMPELVRAGDRRRGSRRVVVAVPLPPRTARAVRDGGLLPGPDATIVGPSFNEWLDGPDGPGGSGAGERPSR
jgi:uncharacterized protein YbjT (DUF2867 family)